MKSVLSTLMLCFVFMLDGSLAASPTIINRELILSKEFSSLNSISEVFAEISTKSSDREKTFSIVGKAKVTPTHHNQKIIQIVWSGIYQSDAPQKMIVLDKPYTSTFKTAHAMIKTHQKITLEGDVEQLIPYLSILESKARNAQLEQNTPAKNPSSTARRVNVSNENNTASTKSELEMLEKDTGAVEKETMLRHSSSIPAAGASAGTSQQLGANRSFGGAGQNNPTFPMGTMNQALNRRERDRPYQVNNPQNNASNSSTAPTHLNAQEGENESNIQVVISKDECEPEVDIHHNRVVMKEKSITYVDGQEKSRTACQNSLDIYPIVKDFSCDQCQNDYRDLEHKQAYSRFKRYWLDDKNIKHVIDEQPINDTSKAYPFVEEEAQCAPLVRTDLNLAYHQYETVYYNRNNSRQVVNNCQKKEHDSGVELIETTHKCPLIHDFTNNYSNLQKRTYFKMNGRYFDAQPCQIVGPPIHHEFVTHVCNHYRNQNVLGITKMARRRIHTESGSQFITDECEPIGEVPLQTRRQGCENEYVHDWASGKSYLKKIFFHNIDQRQEDVTGCMRTDEFIEHQFSADGYRNYDDLKIAKPLTSIYIESDNGRVLISPSMVRESAQESLYIATDSKLRCLNSYYNGCYKMIKTEQVNVYQRPDQTYLEEVSGPGDPISSPVDECVRIDEYDSEHHHNVSGDFFNHHQSYRIRKKRTKITYPDGTEEHTPWVNVGRPFRVY